MIAAYDFRDIFERFEERRKKQLAGLLEKKKKLCRHPSKKYNTRRRRRMIRERCAKFDYWIALLHVPSIEIIDLTVKNPEFLMDVSKKFICEGNLGSGVVLEHNKLAGDLG